MEPGQEIVWSYEPRGGYGYVIPVPGVVVKVAARRVQIEVKKVNGETVRRWVTPERIKAR